MFRILKVTGQSLEPVYQEGDYVLVSSIPFFFAHPRPGDVVVFRQEAYGTLIKRVESVDAGRDEIFVVGTNELSTDSRHFGAIRKKDLIGKVIWHIH